MKCTDPLDCFIEYIPKEERFYIVKFLLDGNNLEIWVYCLHLVISKRVPYDFHKYTDSSKQDTSGVKYS